MIEFSTDAVNAHLRNLTKPPGSLGLIEDVALRLCSIQKTLQPVTKPRMLVIFAGDHGVVQAGVTAWPSEVTGLMVRNIASGGAASSVFARTTDTELRIVDVGTMASPSPDTSVWRCAKVAEGTRDLSQEPAMTCEQFREAFDVGREEARTAHEAGMAVVAAGEMGIGNTTSASCLAALLVPAISPHDAVGPGAGSDDTILQRKRKIVAAAVERVKELVATDPEAAFAAVSGFEITAMAGFYAEAANLGMTIVLDGLIATAAALMAERLHPGTAENMIAGHQSAEPAHKAMLDALGLEPLLTWSMRLGEGTGALAALPALDLAAAMVRDMATFDDLGIHNG